MFQTDYQEHPEEDFFEEEAEMEYRLGTVVERPDRSYQWLYSMDMRKNHSILDILLVVFSISFLIIVITIVFSAGIDFEVFKILVLCFFLVFGIVLFSYWLVTSLQGGSYFMNFEMDEEGVLFQQVASHEEQERLIASLTAMLGSESYTYSSADTGLAKRNASNAYSAFKNVKQVAGDREHNLIRVSSPFLVNLIYVDDAYYEFVFDYIASRCEKARIIPG